MGDIMTSLAVSRSNPLRWTVIGFCLGALCALGARYASDANQKQPPKASKHSHHSVVVAARFHPGVFAHDGRRVAHKSN